MRAITVLAVLAAPALCGQVVEQLGSRPGFERLYDRASRSEFVATGTVVDEKPLWIRRSETEDADPGGLVIVKVTAPGHLYSVDIGQVLCQQSDFATAGASVAPPVRRVYIFLPPKEADKRSDLYPALPVAAEWPRVGRKYLFFLVKDAQKDALAPAYQLDLKLPYYRTFDGGAGAVELPSEQDKGGPRDFATPVLEAVTALCGAVRPADPIVKLVQLRALRQTADPRWRDRADWRANLEAAIGAIERLQGKPPE